MSVARKPWTTSMTVQGDTAEDMFTQTFVLLEILKERERQDEKWGANRRLSNLKWNAILGEEVGEATAEVNEENNKLLELELIQVAAVAIAWLEALRAGRQD